MIGLVSTENAATSVAAIGGCGPSEMLGEPSQEVRAVLKVGVRVALGKAAAQGRSSLDCSLPTSCFAAVEALLRPAKTSYLPTFQTVI